jgi:tRNA pseudouridine38-40 synthase
MRYALKFAYDGAAFEGYARQPEMNTVEGEVVKVMEDLSIIENAKANNFQSASRTDRGVSAAGNVIAINTDFEKDALVPALNSRLADVQFWALTRVDDDFNARHAQQRWYRYLLLKGRCPSTEAFEAAAQTFVGEHDFRSISKKDTGDENTVLTIDSIEVSELREFLIIDIKAQRFLWQMDDFGFETVEKSEVFSALLNRARIRTEALNQICDIISSA